MSSKGVGSDQRPRRRVYLH